MNKQKVTKDVALKPEENVEESITTDAVGKEAGQQNVGKKLEIEVDVETLQVELEQLKEDVEEHKEKYLRAMAEVENTRRRAENDVSSARKFAVESFAGETLSVRDSLELAAGIVISAEDSDVIDKMKEGLDLTLKQLDNVFAKFGIEPIEPELGEKLDPERHQAMTVQESSDVEPNHVVTVVQKGYSIHDRLLRPAMVVVAKAVSPQAAETEAENT
ncbi:MAG: nucleotide exchange factor GrpE [Arenicellales bacterium]|nr:nucleotide exchange factor GrpE [Arenicellales bacterium]